MQDLRSLLLALNATMLTDDSMRKEEPKINRHEPEVGIHVGRDEYKTASQNEEFFNSTAETYEKRYWRTFRTLKKLVPLLQLADNPYLLDLGCGTGFVLRYVANQTNGKGEFYGVDISSKMIELAKAKSQSYDNLHFYKSRVEELPFDDGFFDVVMSVYAFHHFSNPEKTFREANRVLKPKGKLYILDITANNAFTRLLDRYYRMIEPAHVRLYSKKEFQTLFESACLSYVTSKRIIRTVEVHIAEKASLIA